MVQLLWKEVWLFLTKLNVLLPYDPAVAVLGIYSKELKTYVCTKTCTRMFIAALFMISKTWKPPRCPSVGEQINCGTFRQWDIIIKRIFLNRNELSNYKKTKRGEFPCGLMVLLLLWPSSVPGEGTKILRAAQHGQKREKDTEEP